LNGKAACVRTGSETGSSGTFAAMAGFDFVVFLMKSQKNCVGSAQVRTHLQSSRLKFPTGIKPLEK
jgi:hypothetical protein